mmetsp:Transcript_7484/g.17748  ORF Transcript_7484/g.17748 Transcript_7484/m.17748 type:complete len:316 (-) Transcript_7484:19-966(-)
MKPRNKKKNRTRSVHASRRRSPKRDRPQSSEPPQRLVLTIAPQPEEQPEKKARVEMHPRPAHQTVATLLTMTKNNQGEGPFNVGFCLAAFVQEGEDSPGRLIRLVPGIGHFWSEDDLPQELQEMHAHDLQSATRLSWEPHWQFRPVEVGFEAGTLPDVVTGPHRTDDVVSRYLEHLGPVEDLDALDDKLARLACKTLEEVWPPSAWATPRSLCPDADVASLVLIRGSITWVLWRPQAAPLVDLTFKEKEVQRVPFAAHRLHADKGYAMLEFFRSHGECLLLLGLSRTFNKVSGGVGVPQCPILLLRVFPQMGERC